MKKNFNVKRKGFTLVELLIVIVVIGVLSAMMMLSSTEAVTSAKASNVVSNLRNLKTAALALYVDKLDTWQATTGQEANQVPTIAEVQQYMSDANNTSNTSGFTYDIIVASGTGAVADRAWYISCAVTDTKVQSKLAGRAKSVGLLKGTTTGGNNPTTSVSGTYDGTTGTVYMQIR